MTANSVSTAPTRTGLFIGPGSAQPKKAEVADPAPLNSTPAAAAAAAAGIQSNQQVAAGEAPEATLKTVPSGRKNSPREWGAVAAGQVTGHATQRAAREPKSRLTRFCDWLHRCAGSLTKTRVRTERDTYLKEVNDECAQKAKAGDLTTKQRSLFVRDRREIKAEAEKAIASLKPPSGQRAALENGIHALETTGCSGSLLDLAIDARTAVLDKASDAAAKIEAFHQAAQMRYTQGQMNEGMLFASMSLVASMYNMRGDAGTAHALALCADAFDRKIDDDITRNCFDIADASKRASALQTKIDETAAGMMNSSLRRTELATTRNEIQDSLESARTSITQAPPTTPRRAPLPQPEAPAMHDAADSTPAKPTRERGVAEADAADQQAQRRQFSKLSGDAQMAVFKKSPNQYDLLEQLKKRTEQLYVAGTIGAKEMVIASIHHARLSKLALEDGPSPVVTAAANARTMFGKWQSTQVAEAGATPAELQGEAEAIVNEIDVSVALVREDLSAEDIFKVETLKKTIRQLAELGAYKAAATAPRSTSLGAETPPGATPQQAMPDTGAPSGRSSGPADHLDGGEVEAPTLESQSLDKPTEEAAARKAEYNRRRMGINQLRAEAGQAARAFVQLKSNPAELYREMLRITTAELALLRSDRRITPDALQRPEGSASQNVAVPTPAVLAVDLCVKSFSSWVTSGNGVTTEILEKRSLQFETLIEELKKGASLDEIFGLMRLNAEVKAQRAHAHATRGTNSAFR